MEAANFPDDKIFNTIHNYTHLLAGAHRRRVVPLGSPALTRHLAFWNPRPGGPVEDQGDEGGGETDAGDRAPVAADPPGKREALADAALADLYRMLLDRQTCGEPGLAISNLTTNSDFEENGRRLVVLFGSVIDGDTGHWAQWPRQIPRDSYRTIKLAFLWHGLLTTLSFELHTEFLTLTIVVDASAEKSEEQLKLDREAYGEVFITAESKLRELPRRVGAGRGECEELYKYYYYDFWEQFSEEVLTSLGSHNETLGYKFVDFRGLVVGARGEPGEVEIGLPFTRPGPVEQDGTGGGRPSNCHVNSFDKLWNFITCTQHRDTEFTVSRFLGTRAFYATALGIQTRAMLDGIGKPLCYLMYEDTINPWQLGRLIYRVHRAGHTRIAAIMHFEALLEANGLLNRMEAELESANALLYRQPDDKVVTDEEYRDSLASYYLAVEGKIGKIAGLKLDGTLEARIERSRYYVRQFASATAALRIRRVSGFQRYDEFVSQRMGPVFEYIDNLGRKYARVQNDREILLGRIQAYDSQRNQYIVSRAQTIADLALSCVLVPYYGAYVVTNAFSPAISARSIWLTAFCFGVITFVIAHLLRRFWERVTGKQAPDIFRRLAFRYIVAFLAAVLIANLVLEVAPALRETPAASGAH